MAIEQSRPACARCEYCRAPEAIFNFSFEVEHITPSSAGGADADSNLALACRACNLHKSNHTQWTDSETGLLVALFHPRLQAWADHFHADEHGMIVGKTPTGRATVARLQMNSAHQRAARRNWMRLEIYP